MSSSCWASTPRLLPADEADTWRLLWLQADYEFRPDDDSTRLGRALRAALGPLAVGGNGHPAARAARTVTRYSAPTAD